MNLFKRFRGGEQTDSSKLEPIFNAYDINGFAFESDTVRANLFTGFLEPHFHPDEDGVVIYLANSPEACIDDDVKPVEADSLVPFKIRQMHGFRKQGKALVFHGFLPFKQADGYEVQKAYYKDHPQGGQSAMIEWTLNGREQEPIVYGPGSNITLGGALRSLDYEIRKSRGEDVGGLNG